jgi:flavin-dependent dehydrogenase
VRDSYREIVARAHPELRQQELCGRVWGAGPFRTAPRAVAAGRVFLAGDAAGFLDPLTGEAMAAGLAQARALAAFLAEDMNTSAARYRRWHRRQWRRRRLVSGLALALTGSDRLARRALAGVARRPAALERLLQVNDGSRGLTAIRPRDWTALAGF